MGKSRRRRRELIKRTLAIAAIGAIILAAAGAAGYHFFTSWRARDLAAKARANFEQGNHRMAWLQIGSAREMAPSEPEVLRVSAQVETAVGRPEALSYYEKLARTADLTPDDLENRAEAAARFGDDRHFDEAVGALEKSGNARGAGNLRAMRKLRSGDIDKAITEARLAVSRTDDPALKLKLAQLLQARHGPELARRSQPGNQARVAAREITGIVNSLLDTPQKDAALAFALSQVNAPPEMKASWADAAMADLRADNPAVLPAATWKLASGKMNSDDINRLLRPVFDSAPLDRRAAYCLWLTGAGMPGEALSLLTAREAGESTAAFGAFTEALFATGNCEGVIAAAGAGGNVDEDVKLAARARAEYALGRGARSGAKSLADAMRGAARARRLALLLPTADKLGAPDVADETIVEMCADPAIVEHVFPVARDRLSRRGRTSMLAQAFERARAASPSGTAVQDYDRYLRLLKGEPVDPAVTAAAVAANPADQSLRITHALGKLRTGKPAEALAVFDDTTLFADQLPPGQLAVIAAILAANGDTARARAAAGNINLDSLTNEEYALIAPLRMP